MGGKKDSQLQNIDIPRLITIVSIVFVLSAVALRMISIEKNIPQPLPTAITEITEAPGAMTVDLINSIERNIDGVTITYDANERLYAVSGVEHVKGIKMFIGTENRYIRSVTIECELVPILSAGKDTSLNPIYAKSIEEYHKYRNALMELSKGIVYAIAPDCTINSALITNAFDKVVLDEKAASFSLTSVRGYISSNQELGILSATFDIIG